MRAGIRRGKLTCRRAVLIGRAYMWGLGVAGAAGIEQVVRILRREFESAMALCGLPSLAKITHSALWPER